VTLSSEQLMGVLYPGDARRFTRLTLESLNKLTRDHLAEHYRKYYVPSGELAGIVGEISAKNALAKLEKALAGWKGGPVEPVKLPIHPPIAEKKLYLVSRPGSVQTDLTLANRAIDRNSPDYIACLVMNQVLGSGPAARLFRIIREEKGYTYGVSSSFSATRYMQHFSSSMSVRTEVTEPALADLLKEFREIRDVVDSRLLQKGIHFKTVVETGQLLHLPDAQVPRAITFDRKCLQQPARQFAGGDVHLLRQIVGAVRS
jgi:predicted Zn-dependent peptidase